jgi:probable rRNA maturation factor
MTAPPARREAPQIAVIDEVVIVVQGALAVEAHEQPTEVGRREPCMVDRGTKVTYSNASQHSPCEYWSLCMPAFAPERTNMGNIC